MPDYIIMMFWNKKRWFLFFLLWEVFISCNNGNPASDAKITPYEKGKEVYDRTCVACHLASGKGIATTFPPLEKSDFLILGKTAAITQVIKGKTGALIVNGMPYNNIMPPQGLSDEDVANVLTYVYGSFGNIGTKVTAADVKTVRSTLH